MLNNISWKTFLLFLAVFILGYYFVILLLFYRKEFVRIKGKGISGQANKQDDFILANNFLKEEVKSNYKGYGYNDVSNFEDESSPSHDELAKIHAALTPEQINSQVHELLDELKSLLIDFKSKRPIREELLFGIGQILKKYKRLNTSSILTELNSHIVEECKNICSITLSDAEVKMLWNS